jgi:uncharacterized phage-associated protein
MAYDAKAVANFFLDLATENKTTLTPMKLQKLIFFAHGWHLALYDEPLIADPVEAWQFGPVVPTIYHEFKHERSGAITSRATELDLEEFEFVEPRVPEEDLKARLLMQQVWKTYGKYSAVQLSNLTHLAGTPWEEARKGTDVEPRSVLIEDSSIGAYFKTQLQRNRERALSGQQA